MMNHLKRFILKHKVMKKVVLSIYKLNIDIKKYFIYKKNLNKKIMSQPAIYYIGIPAHKNLGDLAQGICIRKWLHKHYETYTIIELETDCLVNTKFSLLNKFKNVYEKIDRIVFQSGYTTTDLGGYADEMHRAVISVLPDAKILMMPQTIFFKDENNKKRTCLSYNTAHNMLFLARDKVSYEMALEMFPDIKVDLYPDIVTTMIGTKSFRYKRNGILFCCRNDTEKYYSDDEIDKLMKKCKTLGSVDRLDTTKNGKTDDIVRNAEHYISEEIDCYAHYKFIITDRYHGTIFSLIAGTPVIIIKTTDHKVTTGADWFKGVYDDYVYLADSLEDAFQKALEWDNKKFNYQLESYFKENYYDELSNQWNSL